MTNYVADHSFSFVSSSQLKSAGYSGDIGYCSHDPSKNWTQGQIKDRLANGLLVGIVWETVNQRAASSGAQGGRDDGAVYLAQAKALGATGGTLWVCLEDPNVLPKSEWLNVAIYANAISQILRTGGFEVGGYGSDALLSHVINLGYISRKWSVETWPRDTWNPDLIQLANSHPLNTFGGAVDCNIAALNWGNTLFFGEDTLTPEQAQQLSDLHDLFLKPVDQVGAGVPWAINEVLNLTRQVIDEVTKLVATPPGSSSLTDIDKDDIAKRVLQAMRDKPLSPMV